MDLSDEVRNKLAEAIELWADENLEGRPTFLSQVVFLSVRDTLLKTQAEIEEIWPTNKEPK